MPHITRGCMCSFKTQALWTALGNRWPQKMLDSTGLNWHIHISGNHRNNQVLKREVLVLKSRKIVTLEENTLSTGLWVWGVLGIWSKVVMTKINIGDTMVYKSPSSFISAFWLLVYIIMSWWAEEIKIHQRLTSFWLRMQSSHMLGNRCVNCST